MSNLFNRWYRTTLPEQKIKELSSRSDLRGVSQTLLFLTPLIFFGTLSVLGWLQWWGWVSLLLYATAFSFLTAAAHELCHSTPFKSKKLNETVYFIVSVLIWHEPIQHRAYHFAHHRHTMQTALVVDPELQLPRPTRLQRIISQFSHFYFLSNSLRSLFMHSFGYMSEKNKELIKEFQRRKVFRNSRVILLFHTFVLLFSIYIANVLPLLLFSLPPIYGGLLHRMCSLSQHPGLPENVPDFRLCCRSIRLPGWLAMLYWNMHYHIEHHMYPSVPFHALPALRQQIETDLPQRKSLLGAWKEMLTTFKRQQSEPEYVCTPILPVTAEPAFTGVKKASSS